ncbi:ribose-phosphate diphosphokinase [Natronomonas sp. EA1]|uniref:ribose-phosphate diphosphokinase n=1 Tax=Natronomonas sp. EA1 TaxID=3421655 RepID=UPI003EBEFF9C
MIIPGSASQSLAAALATELDEPLASVEYESFADGELLARAPDVSGERAVVVAATDSARAHVELLQLQEVADRHFAEVVTVIPYMGYARQDQAFRDGEPVSARAVARAVSTGTDRVLTVNPHEPGVCDFFTVPCGAVDAAPMLAEPLPSLDDPLFLAPDEGATALAETVRDSYGGGETDHFVKERNYDTGEVSMTPAAAETAGRDVVLVDDIIATGGTMSSAISQLADPREVFVTCVHPMLAKNARTRLATAGVTAVYGTDTLERPVSSVSAAPAIAERL